MAAQIKQPGPENDALFKSFYPEILKLVSKRRSSWVMSNEPWEDISSILITRVWRKIHTYDVTQPFDRWCNTLLTNAIINILRDRLYKHAKPCISAGPAGGHCVYNSGEDQCNWTKNGLQCAQCPIFAAWQKKKESKHNISATLSLENHTDEVHSRAHDTVDIDSAKDIIDVGIIAQLPKEEAIIYKLLFIKHWSFARVGKKMGFKPQGSNSVPGYQKLTKMSARFKLMAKQIIEDENLA